MPRERDRGPKLRRLVARAGATFRADFDAASEPAGAAAILGPCRQTGQKLLRFDRRLGARFVAGADEAGRGSLAGPLSSPASCSTTTACATIASGRSRS